jgi:4'-phosphopantetheinyl transferase
MSFPSTLHAFSGRLVVMHLLFKTIDDVPGELGGDEIHLWSAALDRPGDESLLTENEIARANRFKIAHTRNQFISARGQLRIILGRYLGLDPRAVLLSIEQSGKPVLDPSLSSDLKFNVSHSEAQAIYGMTRRGRIGADVEKQRFIPNSEGLVERFFTQRERDAFFPLPEPERLAAFFRAWTRKEAVLKAVGRGVQALDQCDVTFCANEPEMVLRLGDDTESAEKWFLRSWQPQPGYAAAVAVELQPSAVDLG